MVKIELLDRLRHPREIHAMIGEESVRRLEHAGVDLFARKPLVRFFGIVQQRVDWRLWKLVRQNFQDPFGSAKFD